MINIIPNWHPMLVHFTIALLSISVLFYLARLFLPIDHRWRMQWLTMANWNLWVGCVFTIATLIAGWFAYNSVTHDAVSHAAMTLHRNWAVPTAILFLLLGISAINIAKQHRAPRFKFLSISVVAAILLMVTGWLGAEAVYRYGLGVISLPVVVEGADGHNHSHVVESATSDDNQQDKVDDHSEHHH